MQKLARLSVLSASITAAVSLAALSAEPEASGNALTLSSTLQPGALAPETYRNVGRGQSIQGYAVIRQHKDIKLHGAATACASRTSRRTSIRLPSCSSH